MFDIKNVDPSKIKKVSAPFSMDVMREFFLDKSLIFLIDYEQCQLKGKSLLIYLSNLDIPCEIEFSPSVSQDDKFTMLKAYIENRNLFSVPSFTRSMAALIFLEKGVAYGDELEPALFSKQELALFLEQNRELIQKCVRFCDSLPFYAITTTQAYRKHFGTEVEPGVEVIDDPFYVGQNIVDLFYLDSFFDLYFSEPPQAPPAFFKRQFRDQMFRGKSLFFYFANPKNTLMGSLIAVSEKKIEKRRFETIFASL